LSKGVCIKNKIADLQPDPNQARKYMDPTALAELSASIKKSNVLAPIQFCTNDAWQPLIVSGHRRVKAAEMAGLMEISGTYTDGDTRLQGFVENLQREDLLPIDDEEQMDALMKQYAFNQSQLADALAGQGANDGF
jgi:ParB family chromosome partitioning protein